MNENYSPLWYRVMETLAKLYETYYSAIKDTDKDEWEAQVNDALRKLILAYSNWLG
jgi:hypothetical protein